MNHQIIRILHLEDNQVDAKLVQATLKLAGVNCQIAMAQTRTEFEAALVQSEYDVILADYALPSYDGISALRQTRKTRPNVPFIFVSGTIGEDAAIEGLTSGARDYVPKTKLFRLVPAINRALSDAKNCLELKKTETCLEQNRMELKTIYDHAPVMIAVLNSSCEMQYANPAFSEYVGMSYEQMKGGRVGNLLGCKKSSDNSGGCGFEPQCVFCPLHLAIMDTIISGINHSSIEFQTTVNREGGDREIFLLGSTALIDVVDKASLLLCLQDVTALKTAEIERDRLRVEFLQAQKMEEYGRLASGVAHDFNNMLCVIISSCELAMTKVPPGHPIVERLEMVLQTADKAAGLTRQLLAFSRKQVLEPKVFALNEIVTESEKMLKQLTGTHMVFKTFLGADTGHVLADPGQIGQVILNLVVNARDAMPGGGTLTITTSRQVIASPGSTKANAAIPLHGEAFWNSFSQIQPGTYACLSIADTGEGMSVETMTHIFEPFFTTKELGKGTGLGLSTVFGIVKQSNGYISVQSILGKGTEFRVLLPVADSDVIAKTSEIHMKSEPKGNETILVVDDEESQRSLICHILMNKGYAVLKAVSGEEALCLSETHHGPIHLLVTDANMPGMNGLQLWNAISEVRRETRVLFLSGYSSHEISKLVCGGHDFKFLQKPFIKDVLEQKVREALEVPLRRC